MSDMFSIADKVYALVGDVLECKSDDLTRDTEFIADLGADQLDMLEIAQLLQQTFRMQVQANDLERLTTVGLLFDYVHYHANDCRQPTPYD